MPPRKDKAKKKNYKTTPRAQATTQPTKEEGDSSLEVISEQEDDYEEYIYKLEGEQFVVRCPLGASRPPEGSDEVQRALVEAKLKRASLTPREQSSVTTPATAPTPPVLQATVPGSATQHAPATVGQDITTTTTAAVTTATSQGASAATSDSPRTRLASAGVSDAAISAFHFQDLPSPDQGDDIEIIVPTEMLPGSAFARTEPSSVTQQKELQARLEKRLKEEQKEKLAQYEKQRAKERTQPSAGKSKAAEKKAPAPDKVKKGRKSVAPTKKTSSTVTFISRGTPLHPPPTSFSSNARQTLYALCRPPRG